MPRCCASRMTNWFAALAYLLAIVASSVSHVHFHALAGSNSVCTASEHHSACDHEHEADPRSAHSEHSNSASSEHGETPTGDDDCNICRFLCRPVLQVTLFEIVESFERIASLPAEALPEVSPTVIRAAQARAPPFAAV